MPNTPPPPRHFDLPPEVAVEIAGYLRSSLFAPLSSNITRLRDECNVSMSAQKDILQDAQSQISNVIEPAAAQLIPIATELNSVYQQIDLLEGLILRVNENIRQMTSKVERTELALRREERALGDGKPPPMWKEHEKVKVFQAKDYVENGRLKETAAL
ncbi:uncharacterized protein LAJ45_09958 [Morchella importuna]|uniref:uncharacterized protein n=1 Tax=Morchella importuna TaxID=1174673 RepID=UPI001E8EB2F2|nr:uncharacterized protein LAJ45_09958 [Morchella importuna]KAH8146036.1 hypothetical protein LAJ45_09958 [Morchella importuna]